MWNILEWLVYSLYIKEIICYSYFSVSISEIFNTLN